MSRIEAVGGRVIALASLALALAILLHSCGALD